MIGLLASNKRAVGVRNILGGVIFLFLLGFFIILGFYISTEMITEYQSEFATNADIQETGNRFLAGLNFFDGVTVFVMFFLIIGMGLTTYKLSSAPIGFLLVFFMSAFLGAISYFFNFIFQEMVSQAIFTTTLTHFPITLFICGNLHWVALIMIIYGSITLYGKRTEQEPNILR